MKKVLTWIVMFSLIGSLIGCAGGGAAEQPEATGTDAAPAAGAGDANTPVKLRIAWWGGQSRHDYTLKVIEMYEKQNPHVTIEPEYAPFDDYWKKLAPQAVAGGLPDIIQMDISYLNQYAGRNQLADLKPFMDSGSLNVDDISENALSGGEVDGKLVAMNLGVNALQTTFDVETMKANGIDMPPMDWTWDDMDKLGAQAKEKGYQIGGFAYRHDVFFPYYLRTIGQKMYSEDGKTIGYPDDQAFIDYFTRYQRWYDSGYILSLDKEAQKKGVAEEDEIVLGNSISGTGWSNQFLAVANLVPDRPLELHPMPGPGIKEGLFLKPSMYFSVTESSKNKEEAAKFISFFVNDIEANKLIMGERGVPVSSKVKEELLPLLSENEAKIFEYVTWAEENSSPGDPPNPIGAVEIEKLLRDLSERILFKKISIEDAAAEFRSEANAILARSQQ
ncbi:MULTISPECIES: ABC transporter substrate-binding protein [Paenibacillus]|uniref:Sugar ABC transporter substrate-binding protein n=1 Tax=Paenibacillus campinasensis TaxID=66347 RepID=A0A268ERQ7_9BACL|nr:ABC transporter substrate-binding protein [Paenibacillus campinasensis]PAD75796.1 sugar ABC transporter substrate-binding protein [Paenibacillus campinasensis]